MLDARDFPRLSEIPYGWRLVRRGNGSRSGYGGSSSWAGMMNGSTGRSSVAPEPSWRKGGASWEALTGQNSCSLNRGTANLQKGANVQAGPLPIPALCQAWGLTEAQRAARRGREEPSRLGQSSGRPCARLPRRRVPGVLRWLQGVGEEIAVEVTAGENSCLQTSSEMSKIPSVLNSVGLGVLVNFSPDAPASNPTRFGASGELNSGHFTDRSAFAGILSHWK